MGELINAARKFAGLPPVMDQAPGKPQVESGYLRELGAGFLTNWNPMTREPLDEVMEAWLKATTMAVDALHNSGWLAGGLDTAVAQMNGNGLQLALKPAPGILGTPEATRSWARDVEQRWWAYANNPYNVDLGGRYSLGQITAQGCRQQMATGEIVATVPYKKRPGNTHGTKINLLPSTRLTQVSRSSDRIVQGVQLDPDFVPIGYLFEQRDLSTGEIREKLVAARDETGRTNVMHLLDAAPTAVRGITPLAPILRVVRQYDQLADATLVAALIQTIFAATIESDAPTKEILAALQNVDEQEEVDAAANAPGGFQRLMQARGKWYSKTNFDLGQNGKIVHTFPGEKLHFNRTEHPNTGYEVFAKGLLREVARCLGITYEQLTGDWVGATYSSIRMAIADMWLITLYRRAYFPGRLNQMLFECWLEEDIELGNTPFPGGVEAFRAQRAQVCQADWRGPPKPTADDLKTAKAQQIQRAEGWVAREQLAAEYGNDWRDVDEAQAVEQENRERLKLPPLPSLGGGGNGAGSAAVAGADGKPKPPAGRDDVDERLVGALMRDDDAAVQEILENEVMA